MKEIKILSLAVAVLIFNGSSFFYFPKEGHGYLDRNLTEWKKPYLMAEGEEEEEAPTPKKPKLAKHSTMKGTAKVCTCVILCIFKPSLTKRNSPWAQPQRNVKMPVKVTMHYQ